MKIIRTTQKELRELVMLVGCRCKDKMSKKGVLYRQFINRKTGNTVGFFVNGQWPGGDYTKYYRVE